MLLVKKGGNQMLTQVNNYADKAVPLHFSAISNNTETARFILKKAVSTETRSYKTATKQSAYDKRQQQATEQGTPNH